MTYLIVNNYLDTPLQLSFLCCKLY